MSDPNADLVNKSLLLGQAMGDLARARGSEAVAVLQTGSADRKARAAVQELEATKKELAMAQATIIDWMHGNEAFKRLAREYGIKLGLSQEQRQMNFDETILDIAESDATFKNSAPLRKVLRKRAEGGG